MQTMEQKRAAHAWGRLEEIARLDKAQKQEFLAAAKGLPATVLMAGLGQAAAMLLAKEGAPRLLYGALESWLCRQDPLAPFAGGRGLLPSIMACSRDEYLAAQREALLWLEWLKKLAVARLAREGAGQ